MSVRRTQSAVFDIVRAALAGHWTREDFSIDRLDLSSSQGEVHFSGRVAQRRVYTGEGRGRFRWAAGGRTYAGTLESRAAGNDVTLVLRLTSPLGAKLDAAVEQTPEWPWSLTLDVPDADPREELMPDGKLFSLSASLRGRGSLARGTFTGMLHANGEPLYLDALRFELSAQKLAFDTVLRVGQAAGLFEARGEVALARDPLAVSVDASWRDVVIPPAWAGQELHTRGQLAFSGGTQAYTAKGMLNIGPAQRPADLALAISGSHERVELEKLDILQKAGRLAAHGRVDLQPQLAWRLSRTCLQTA